MSTYFVLNKQPNLELTNNNATNNKSATNTFFGFKTGDLLILLIIDKHLSAFGGINFEKYKVLSDGEISHDFYHYKNPMLGYWEHKGWLSFESLNKEDYNRLAAAFLLGANEIVKTNKEDYIQHMKQYSENENITQYYDLNQEAFKEAIPKFKADPRYNPKWKYDPNVKNNEEIIYDLDEVVKLRELKEVKESKE